MFWKYFLLGEIWSRPDAYICILWWDGDGTIWVMTWFDLRYSIAKPISIPFWQFWSFSLRSAHGCLEALRSLRGMSLSVQHTSFQACIMVEGIWWSGIQPSRVTFEFLGITLPPIIMVQWKMSPKFGDKTNTSENGPHFPLNHDYGRTSIIPI